MVIAGMPEGESATGVRLCGEVAGTEEEEDTMVVVSIVDAIVGMITLGVDVATRSDGETVASMSVAGAVVGVVGEESVPGGTLGREEVLAVSVGVGVARTGSNVEYMGTTEGGTEMGDALGETQGIAGVGDGVTVDAMAGATVSKVKGADVPGTLTSEVEEDVAIAGAKVDAFGVTKGERVAEIKDKGAKEAAEGVWTTVVDGVATAVVDAGEGPGVASDRTGAIVGAERAEGVTVAGTTVEMIGATECVSLADATLGEAVGVAASIGDTVGLAGSGVGTVDGPGIPVCRITVKVGARCSASSWPNPLYTGLFPL